MDRLNREAILYFPSFSEGLSLRHVDDLTGVAGRGDFPSFSEGLSLRRGAALGHLLTSKFPFLFGGTFIEALHLLLPPLPGPMISLPFRRDFH